jgi:integrase
MYARFLKETNKEVDEHIFDLKYPTKEQTYKGILSDREIEQVLNIKRNGNECKRTYKMFNLFFSILAYTGARPGEIAQLKVNCCDFGRDVFVLEEQTVKTKEMRIIPIPPNLIEPIHKWIKLEQLKDSQYLFYLASGKIINDTQWGYHFDKRVRQLGLKRKGISLYSFRHSLITSLLAEDVNLFKVQKLVGHKNINTTLQYTHLTTKDIQNTIRKLPLLRNKLAPHATVILLKELIQSFQIDERFSYTLKEGKRGISFTIRY